MIYRPVVLTPIFPLTKVFPTIYNILWRNGIQSDFKRANGLKALCYT